jgi:hypothetical protein
MSIVVECRGVSRRLRGRVAFSGPSADLRALAQRLMAATGMLETGGAYGEVSIEIPGAEPDVKEWHE